MLAGNCPIQLDGYVCTAWGGVACALRVPSWKLLVLQRKGWKVLEGTDYREKRSGVGYKTIIK